MSESVWRFAYASVAGTSHVETATPCQDASRCEVIETAGGECVLVAVAADGAGSATHAEQGAQLACAQLIECARSALHEMTALANVGRVTMRAWINTIRQHIEREAELANTDRRAFACTLLVALIGEARAVFAQIGDGAMVIASTRANPDLPREYEWVFWPEQGEYVNTTRFITDRGSVGDGDGDGDSDSDINNDIDIDSLKFMAIERRVEEVSVFTDGLQHLALQYEPPVAYAPFFSGLFPPVRRITPEQIPELSKALATYLSSPRIHARTDDDKTLILATRVRR